MIDPREEEMIRLTGLVELELGERQWVMILESPDRSGSGILAPAGMHPEMVIAALKIAIETLEKNG